MPARSALGPAMIGRQLHVHQPNSNFQCCCVRAVEQPTDLPCNTIFDFLPDAPICSQYGMFVGQFSCSLHRNVFGWHNHLCHIGNSGPFIKAYSCGRKGRGGSCFQPYR
ncbi:unnamed protein product [Haemonchus placei]|uniref:Uncharacterized protein n=1 Tax=Haemonchus placei TaxID=6290 RepID=A0A0N4X7L4_HAEPC|nr:unnamed protein product [Haemonchus placei]